MHVLTTCFGEIALYLVNFNHIISKCGKELSSLVCLVNVSQRNVSKWVIRQEADKAVKK